MGKEKKNTRAWWKDFIIGVTATAIGVGLSFAVNNMVENHKKAQARRQTAMMAVYDIDQIVRELKEYRQKEDRYYKVASYLATHQDEIDSISMDSLRIAIVYLTEDIAAIYKWADDSKEKAFNSSMDAWQNLENTRFYDNVLMCYGQRSELLKTMESDVVFKRPISDEEFNDFFLQAEDSELDYSGGLDGRAMARLLKQVLPRVTTTRFLRTYFLRVASLAKCSDELVRLNQENKFLMNFTDKEIEDYIHNNVDRTRPATAKKLQGEWVASIDDDRTQVFRLNPDNTATFTSDVIYNMSLYVQEEDVTVALNCPMSYRIEGNWAVEKDSLKMDFNPETSEILSFDMDLSSLPKAALQHGQDSLARMRQNVKDYIHNYIKQSGWSMAYKVSLDVTGNIMFWTNQYTNQFGDAETEQQQLVRRRVK